MAEIKIKNFIVEFGDKKYKMIGSRLEDICEELGISEDRFIELLSRDAYCPTMSAAPTSSTLTYVDTDGSTNHFHVGQLCRWAEGSDYRLAVCKNATQTSVAWHILPTKISELTNDAGYLTQHQDISHLATTSDLSSGLLGKVDKVDGKQLSTEDFTTVLKNKLNGLSNYDDTTITAAVNKLRTDFDTLVSGDTTTAIKSFNEIVAFLDGISDSEDLESIIASIERQIAAKQDKITDLDTIRGGAAKGATALQSYTETDPVFSKSAAAGITSSDISNWNGKTSNTGTVTGVKINGTTKSPTNGVVDLGTVITSHQDISGKVDKVSGKGLSTNDYTTNEKNKLAGIAAGAEVNVQSDWNATSGDAFIKNKPTIPSAITVDSSLSSTSTNPVQNKVINSALSKKGTYSKPSGGIPKSDLASAVQTSLGKADTALQPTSIAASAQKLVKSDGTTKVHVGNNGNVTIGGGTYSDFALTILGYTYVTFSDSIVAQFHSTGAHMCGIMLRTESNQGYLLYYGGSKWCITDNEWKNSYDIVHAGNVSEYLSSSSDAAKKNVIGDVGLDVSQIANAPVVRFTWKEGDDKEHVGTIAQYWKEVLPEVVIGEEGNLKMDYASLGVVNSIVLAKKVKEQEAAINELKNEIAELKKRL